jgi:hypothetical protein
MEFSNLEIFILSYNRPELLKRCLKSFSQSPNFKYLDITILDNASDFDVFSILNIKAYDHVKIVRNENNIGANNNFAKALNLSSREFIMVFHDDDCISPNLIKVQLDLFNKYKDIGFIVTVVNLVDNLDEMLYFKAEDPVNFKYYANIGDILDIYYSNYILGFSSIMYRTSILKQSYNDTVEFAQVGDRALMLYMSLGSPFVLLNSPSYNAYQHIGQESFSRNWEYSYDIKLINLYFHASSISNKIYLNSKIAKSASQLYSLRRPLPSLFSTLKNTNFNTKIEVLVFLLYIPYFYFRSRLIHIIKKNTPFFYKMLVRIKKNLK